jgi:hypothetical protein
VRGRRSRSRGADQQRPQDEQREIEAADELAEGGEDLRALLGDRAATAAKTANGAKRIT